MKTIEFPKSLRAEAIKFEWEGLGQRPLPVPVYAIYGANSKLGHTRIRIAV